MEGYCTIYDMVINRLKQKSYIYIYIYIYTLLKKIKGTLKQHLKSKNKKKVFNKIISFIQIYDVLF